MTTIITLRATKEWLPTMQWKTILWFDKVVRDESGVTIWTRIPLPEDCSQERIAALVGNAKEQQMHTPALAAQVPEEFWLL